MFWFRNQKIKFQFGLASVSYLISTPSPSPTEIKEDINRVKFTKFRYLSHQQEWKAQTSLYSHAIALTSQIQRMKVDEDSGPKFRHLAPLDSFT